MAKDFRHRKDRWDDEDVYDVYETSTRKHKDMVRQERRKKKNESRDDYAF